MKAYVVMIQSKYDPDCHKSIHLIFLDEDKALCESKFYEVENTDYWAHVEEHELCS